MSKRENKRRVIWTIITPCLAAFLVFLLMYDQPSHVENDRDNRQASGSADYANQSSPDYQSVTLGWRLRQVFNAFTSDPIQAPKIDPKCDPNCQRAEQDLGAQLDMAFWAQGMFWANCLIVMVTAVGVFYVARTLGATSTAAKATLVGAQAAIQANKISHEMMVVDQRAWVAFDGLPKVTDPLEWHLPVLNFEVVLINTGKTPARNVKIDTQICSDRYGEDSRAVHSRIIGESRIPFGLYTIAPGGKCLIPVKVAIDGEILGKNAAANAGYPDQPVGIIPVLVGCIRYATIFNNVEHKTSFAYRIGARPDDRGYTAVGPAFGDLPTERIYLEGLAGLDLVAD